MKLLIALAVLFSVSSAQAEGYYGRFWRGAKKTAYPDLRNYCDDRYSDCFLELVNRWLIPATPSYAAKDALMAYAPVLLPSHLHKKYKTEVALILYSSESDYRRLRGDKTNAEGSTYGPIHGDIFDMGIKGTKKSSRSLVPQAYAGSIELAGELREVSYDLLSKAGDIVNSHGEFLIIIFHRNFQEKKKFQAETYIKALKESANRLGLVASYVLVTEKYMMQYNFTQKPQASALKQLRNDHGLKTSFYTGLKELNPVQESPLLYERITYGEGGNLQFTPGEKPGTADHYRLHMEEAR